MQPQQQPFGYYEPPRHTRGRPAVILWFRFYAVSILLLYAGFLALWQFLTPADPSAPPREWHFNPTPEGLIALLLISVLALGFSGLHIVGAMVPYKPWGWTVGLIAICLGLTSCTAVFAIPLLVYWLKPETKAAFCRL